MLVGKLAAAARRTALPSAVAAGIAAGGAVGGGAAAAAWGTCCRWFAPGRSGRGLLPLLVCSPRGLLWLTSTWLLPLRLLLLLLLWVRCSPLL
jgi:hypothetical protein